MKNKILIALISLLSLIFLIAYTADADPLSTIPIVAALTPTAIYAAASPSVVEIKAGDGKKFCKGTGFFYTYKNRTFVITARHVTDDTSYGPYHVTLKDGTVLNVVSILASKTQDVEVLTVDKPLLPSLGLVLSVIKPGIGTEAYIIGYPLQYDDQFFTSGMIDSYETCHEFSGCPMSLSVGSTFGDSGGPVLDSTGVVIGLVDEMDPNAEFIRQAIPSTVVKVEVELLIDSMK